MTYCRCIVAYSLIRAARLLVAAAVRLLPARAPYRTFLAGTLALTADVGFQATLPAPPPNLLPVGGVSGEVR